MKSNYSPINVIIKGENANFIALKRDLIYDKESLAKVSNEELVVIIGLCSMNVKQYNKIYVTPRQLYYELTKTLYVESKDRRFMNLIIKGLLGLINKDIIKVDEGLSVGEKPSVNTAMILNVGNLLKHKNEGFIAIDEREVERILNINKVSDGSCSRDKLLSLFIAIISSISIHETDYSFAYHYEDIKLYEGLVCFKSYETLAKISGIVPKTISSYIDKLEEMKLIYCHGFDKKREVEGRWRNLNNWYARYQMKEQVIMLAELKDKQTDHALYTKATIHKSKAELDKYADYSQQEPIRRDKGLQSQPVKPTMPKTPDKSKIPPKPVKPVGVTMPKKPVPPVPPIKPTMPVKPAYH